MDRLTKRQYEVLRYIKIYMSKKSYPPTRQEISDHFNFKSLNAANDHLLALHKKGFIELKPGLSRGISIIWSSMNG